MEKDFFVEKPLDQSETNSTDKPAEEAEVAEGERSEKSKVTIFDTTGLMSGLNKCVKVINEIPSWLPASKDVLNTDERPAGKAVKGDPTDAAQTASAKKDTQPDPRAEKALAATKLADSHDSLYLKLQKKASRETLEPGEHKNEDGSLFKVNAQGQITELKTAPSKEFPQGAHYKNIRYDQNGDVWQYQGPSNHWFTRTTGSDQNGFANWQCTTPDQRYYATYSGANAAVWRGKAVVDSTGFHTLVGNDPNHRAMHSRNLDGSTVSSTFPMRDQFGLIMQNIVTIPDGTEVARNGRVAANKIVVNNDLRVKEAGTGKGTLVNVDSTTGEAKVVQVSGTKKATSKETTVAKETAVTKETPASKDVKRIAENVAKRVADCKDPVGDVIKAVQNLDKLRQANLVRRVDGKHNVDLHFNHATVAQTVYANVRGFRAGPTRTEKDVSFTLSHSADGIRIENVQGVSGSVIGRRGRVRPSWTNGLHITHDQQGVPCVNVDSTVRGPLRFRGASTQLHENNFAQGSLLHQQLHNPDALRDVASAVRLFQKADDLLQASITKTKAGFDITTKASQAKRVDVNQGLAGSGSTVKALEVEPTLSASISHDAKGAQLHNIKGLKVQLATSLGETTVTPKMVRIEKNCDGEPVVRLEIEHPKFSAPLPLEIPLAELKAAGKK